MQTIFQIWINGWVIMGRWLWFCLRMFLMVIPFKFFNDFIVYLNSFCHGSFNFNWLNWIASLMFGPLIYWAAAQITGYFKSGRKKESSS
jgi:hypothetical protein